MSARDHRRLLELLPWYAAGALDPVERERVAAHVESCAECRGALDEEVVLREAVRAVATPRLAPHPASFQRVLDSLERAERRGLDRRLSSFGVRFRRLLASRRLRLAALVLAQNAVLVLIVVGLTRPPEPSEQPRFETRAAASAEAAERLRLVFRDDVAMWEVVDLLRALDLELVGGPSAVGVFEVAVPAGRDRESVARELRADPRVRLVAGVP